MHRLNRVLSGVLVAVAVGACSDALNVTNTNNPDRVRVYARATDIEALISGAYNSVHNGTFGTDGLAPSARTMSWENASNLANWGLGPRSAIPRSLIDNTRGNPYQGENQADFNATSRASRSAADGLNRMILGGVTLGSAAQDARAKAFGWFVLGVGMGYLAMDYDSGTIISPYDELGVIPDLVSYAEVNVGALAALDSALTWTATSTAATAAGGTNGFPLPNTWINGYAPTAADFIKLVRSYRAYFRANVARTPADRAAVAWATVAADAALGITTDIMVTIGSGWSMTGNQWWLYAQWHQLHQLIGGMADSTGVYPAWLASANKTQFLIVTADRRFPQGTTRAAQITNSPAVPVGTIPAVRPYFRNRSTADPDAAPWSSYYDWYRMIFWRNASNTGPYPVFVKAQNDLLRAEALIRTGQIPAAAALIDISRVAAGLPALAGVITTATDVVPGGAGCVPHVPQAPTYLTTACGTIMEAMKWEYRMETMFVSYVSQWYSGRGWGDLPEGTAVHWPVPYNEMDTRRHPFYNLGGVGSLGGSVGKGNYGY
jgi:hypothetical protein